MEPETNFNDWFDQKYPDPDIIKIRALSGSYQIPSKQHDTDVGYDLHSSDFMVIPAHDVRDIPCGFAMEMPDRMWARITGRSSTIRKHRILVVEGIIDAGYRGPIFYAAFNLTDEDFVVPIGSRLAQMIFGYRTIPMFEMATRLESSERGEDGFGSTGT